MVHVIGRLDDLQRRGVRPGERRLGDELARWSLDGNAEWLGDGVRQGEPFLQISAAAAGSVLAWELDWLAARGYVAVGPFWVPAPWFRDAASYRRVLHLVAAHVMAQPAAGEALYVPKASAEFEPLLALWPHVLALPVTRPLTPSELIAARAWPVHALGVVPGTAWADGRPCAPAEFFCHDLDHARFKVREDLLGRGIAVADPYRDGSTFDAVRGVHRTVLDLAAPHVDGDGWQRGPERAARAQRWLAALASAPDRDLAAAARWLLFELVHEKSLPLEPAVLGAALAGSAHVDRLRGKVARGFFAAHGPSAAVVARLTAARTFLRELVEAPESS